MLAVPLLRTLNEVIRNLDAIDGSHADADEPTILHESPIKAQAALVLGGLINRAKGDAASPIEDRGVCADDLPAIRQEEAELTSFLFDEYSRIAHLKEDAAARRAYLSEMVLMMWQMADEHEKMRWRAIARNHKLLDTERVWITTALSDRERTVWDSEAMASWVDYLQAHADADASYVRRLQAQVVLHMSRRLHGDDSHPAHRRLANASRYLLKEQLPLHHGTRRLAELSEVVHEKDVMEGVTHTTSIILRTLGNIGSPEYLPFILNFTYDSSEELRNSALNALRFLPADAVLPSAEPVITRRLLKGIQTGASSLLFSGLEKDVSDVMVQYHARVLSSVSKPAISKPSSTTTVEASLLALLQHADTPLDTKATVVTILTDMRPLQPSTVDVLLDLFEAELSHIDGYHTPEICSASCVDREPSCRVLPRSVCLQDCQLKCDQEYKLAKAIAVFIDKRVKQERKLAETLQEGASVILPDEELLASAPELQRAAERLVAHARKTAGQPGAIAASDLHFNPTSFRPRVLSQQVGLPSAGSISGKSFSTPSGLAPSTAAYRARRLGVITLLDLSFSAQFSWQKVFGEHYGHRRCQCQYF